MGPPTVFLWYPTLAKRIPFVVLLGFPLLIPQPHGMDSFKCLNWVKRRMYGLDKLLGFSYEGFEQEVAVLHCN
jgi:hypothetical protein